MSEQETVTQSESNSNTNNSHLNPWVVFKLFEEKYALKAVTIQEVFRIVDIVPVPGAPDYILGIINSRGIIITIIDLRTRFGLPFAEPNDSSRIIVLENDNHPIGLLVDTVAEVIWMSDSDIGSAPGIGTEATAEFIQGVSQQGDNNELLILLNLERITDDEP
ncbi:chemotaxis protein CheW [Dongshaea marina]|uniref:chemotaxis protein CheW n=1 Tax=Dongshaea marina TaxID=2047966 RepID=UPI000D3E08EB|nr:chemotaxis protein CheW [Dongshaea marina]